MTTAGVMLSLAGKMALITGGSRGIGAETLRLFHAAGSRVVFSYRAARAEAEALASACGGPGNCWAIQQELASAGQGIELVEKTVQHADYAVTKGALISLTKSLSSELAPEGIHVNCVAPGWVQTDMSASALAEPVKSRKILPGIPLGRAGTPMEIAGPILFLCTPLAGFISGEVVNVNGGAVLAG